MQIRIITHNIVSLYYRTMPEIRPIADYVYFKIEKPAEDVLETKVGSLYLSVKFDETHNGVATTYGKNTRIYGEVIAVPTKLSRIPTHGADQWGDEYRYISDINPIVRPGDRIYYHFNTISEDNRLKECFEDFTSKIYKVRYEHIFCLVRDGQIVPVGDYVLVEKTYDTDVQPVDVNGKEVMAKMTGSGLVTEIGVKPKTEVGTVAFIGPPLNGDPDLGLTAGDLVLFIKDSDWVNVIEGKEYYIMHQRDIMGKYEK